MQNARLKESQMRVKIARRKINNVRYADDTTLIAESEEELKSLLIRVKEEGEEAGLKFSIQKTKVMASSPNTSWQIDGGKWKHWQTIFLGSRITVDGDCSHVSKRCFSLERKAMTNLDSILKKRDITLPQWSISVQFSSVTQSCLTLCNPVDCSMPVLPVHHQLLEFTQTHVHWVGDAIQPPHPLSSPSSPAFSLSQHQGLF